MRAIKPKAAPAGATYVILARDQAQYVVLPAYVGPDGLVLTEWVLEPEETALLVAGGRIQLWTHTFGQPFQPVALEVVR